MRETLIDFNQVFKVVITDYKELNYTWKEEPEVKQFLFFKWKNRYTSRFVNNFYDEESYTLEEIKKEKSNDWIVKDNKLLRYPRLTFYIGRETFIQSFKSYDEAVEFAKEKLPHCNIKVNEK